jgi:hypothetical protein
MWFFAVETATVVDAKRNKQREQSQGFLSFFLVAEAAVLADAIAEKGRGRHFGRKWELSFLVFLVEVVIVVVTVVADIPQAVQWAGQGAVGRQAAGLMPSQLFQPQENLQVQYQGGPFYQ